LGTLDKKKGVYDLLYAFLIFHQKHLQYHLLFAGDGPELDKLKKLVCNLKALEFIHFLGWVPHSETTNFLNELKALILPSYTEGIPTVVLEAMACKTPVIVTPVGGIPDIIKEGETGFIINDINRISNDLEKVINFTNMNVLLMKSRELVGKKFSFKNCYSFFKNVIDSN
jgi:glycosyltransferase involved in cell wall biosynthesis